MSPQSSLIQNEQNEEAYLLAVSSSGAPAYADINEISADQEQRRRGERKLIKTTGTT